MIFNPLTQDLFTDSKIFIKKLSCPYQVDWEEFTQEESSPHKICQMCQHTVVETKHLSDHELFTLIKEYKSTCLKIDLNQHSIKISNSL